MTDFSYYLKDQKIFSCALKYIINNNVSAYNPYHSTFHLLDVFTKSIEISDTYDELSEIDKIEIGLAALFHDFNHSGGKLKDYENIELSLNGFHDFYLFNYYTFKELKINYDNIVELIKCTEFPHKSEPKNLKEMIIRDSDLIQCYNKNWFLNVIMGFFINEMNIDINTAIENQIKYINSVSYYTEHSKSIHDSEKETMLKNLNYFKEIYK